MPLNRVIYGTVAMEIVAAHDYFINFSDCRKHIAATINHTLSMFEGFVTCDQ